MKKEYRRNTGSLPDLSDEELFDLSEAERIFGTNMDILSETEYLLDCAITYWTDQAEEEEYMQRDQKSGKQQKYSKQQRNGTIKVQKSQRKKRPVNKLRVFLLVVGVLVFIVGTVWALIPGCRLNTKSLAVLLFMTGSGIIFMQLPLLYREDAMLWEDDDTDDLNQSGVDDLTDENYIKYKEEADTKEWEPKIILLFDRAGFEYGKGDCLDNLCELSERLFTYRELKRKNKLKKER